MPAITPPSKVVFPPLSKACLLSGDLTPCRENHELHYGTFGCVPMFIWLGPSFTFCQGCVPPPLAEEGSAHTEQPPSRLCLLCSSWEALNQDALASSLCTASLNFYRVKRVLFKGCSFTVTKPEMGGEQQLLCVLCALDLNYSLCPWITTLAITPGGLLKHCSSWRAFFMIQGQAQRQNSHWPHPKIQN